jgi:hypothetical protein
MLVISSDDWGGANPPETTEDLDRLSDVLKSVTDARGNPLVLTVYLNPAEPDFKAIAASEYTSYSYRYCYRDKPQVAQQLRELHEAGILDIQFHAREHYNIPLWLSLLQEDRPGFREACVAGCIPWREGPSWDVEADPRLPFLRQSFIDASSYPPKALPVEKQSEMISTGLAMMKSELGIQPVLLTAPGYAYDTNTLHAMGCVGIWHIDSNRGRIRHVDDQGNITESTEYWDYGVEIAGVTGIVRNVSLEPYRQGTREALDIATVHARRALLSARPIVVSSHRWNYVAAVNPNRDRDSLLLKEFAARIRAEAPDIQFLSAADLVKYLYLGGEGASRDMQLELHSLHGMKRVVHGLRCTWMGHSRIRVAACAIVFSLLWLCVASGLWTRLHKKLVVGGSGGVRSCPSHERQP